MRIVPVIGLLAGCNWVFGLGDTSLVPPDVLLPPHVFLTRQVLLSPDQAPELTPIAGLTNVKVGLLTETETSMPTVGTDGGFDLPFALEGQPYRVTFTMPGETFEREIVWTGIDQAHYVVPIFGPVDRTAPPAGAVIKFDAGQLGYSNPSVLTTGLWTRESIGNATVSTPNPVVDDYDKSTPMGGPLGTLSTSNEVFLVDYLCPICDSMHLTNLPNHISGFAKSSLDLVGGTNAVSGTWNTPTATGAVSVNMDGGVATRVMVGLDNNLVGVVTTVSSAVVPSVAMPGAIQLREDGSLAEPVMFALSNTTTGMLDAAINPFVGPDLLPPVLSGRWEGTRLVNSTLPLSTGFTVIQDPTDTDVTACVDMPTAVMLQDPSPGGSTLDLGQMDLAKPFVSTKTVPLVLTFAVADTLKEPKCTTALGTQDCVVTVFELGAMTTTTKRIIDTVITGSAASVAIDPSAFDFGKSYSLAISCKSGYEPGAFAKGRFDAILLPFSASTNYTSAFQFTMM